MFPYQVSFESPWYLPLLALVPVLWWYSFRSLAALGMGRRILSLVLRSLVLLAFVLALAEVQLVRTNDRLTVFFLLDQSESIPAGHRAQMLNYVNEAILKHRQRDDRVAVIVFGRDAAIEIPPFDDDVQILGVETDVDRNNTDLSAALRLAHATFPEDTSKRVVVVSDGNENLGDGAEQAQALVDGGVGIDAVAVRYQQRGEVIVERVSIPSSIRQGQPFDVRVRINNTKQPTDDEDGVVQGRLVVKRQSEGASQVISDDSIELRPGEWPYFVRQGIDATGFFQYQAEFIPEREEDDTMPQNNRATTFAHIRGKGKILVIEDEDSPGEFQRLVLTLRRQSLGGEELGGQKLEVTVRDTKRPFSGLAELQQFDAVILADIPRERLDDAQIRMLVTNTEEMGAGLIMLGGEDSFGAGGWANSELEKAMPVDFHIKATKVIPRGALAMIMHASEMAQGNFWQKEIGEAALETLGPRDYCGVIHYGPGGEKWLWKPGLCEVGGNKRKMLALMDRMTPGDMPTFDPGLRLAFQGLDRLSKHPDPSRRPAIRHLLVISDGDPQPPSNIIVQKLAKSKITVSTVAVACHGKAESKRLENLAKDTGGRYYEVKNPKTLPKIFQKEARRVAQPLIYENPSNGFSPYVKFPHEMIQGVGQTLPKITGFVMTTVKENPYVEVALVSPEPGPAKNCTILASWTYGLGKSVAFTTDAGARWASDWTEWEHYDKLFGQMVVWAMRPPPEEGQFTVTTEVVDEEVRVVVTAMDKNDEYLNFLDMVATVIQPGPELETTPLKIEQTAPGRYVGTFKPHGPGSYFVMISPGVGMPPIRTGVSVPYSDEFRGRAANASFLGQLADLVPEGGKPGRLILGPEQFDDVKPYLAVNTFRRDLAKATSSQPVWFYLVLLGSCLFFFDVFVRRVQVGFAWVPALAGRVRDRLFGRAGEPEKIEVMERLRSSKTQVDDRIEQLRAGARFEPSPDAPTELDAVDQLPADEGPRREAPGRPSLTPEPEEESYTERLLRAKQQAWQKRKKTTDDQ